MSKRILHRLRHLILNTALSLGVVVLFLVLAEGALQAAHWNPPRFVTLADYREMKLIYRPDSKGLWCGQLGHVMDFQNVVETNSLGLHDTEHTPDKPADVYRIVCMGDSFVEAFQVSLEDTFFKKLEHTLNEKKLFGSKRVEVIAFGRSGRGGIEEAVELQTLGMQYHPDLVLAFLVAMNDFKDDIYALKRMSARSDDSDKANYQFEPGLVNRLAWYNRLVIFKKSKLNLWAAFKIVRFMEKGKMDRMTRTTYLEDFGVFEKEGVELPFLDTARGIWQNSLKLTASGHLRMKGLAESQGADFATIFVDNQYLYNPPENLYRLVPELRDRLDFNRPIAQLKMVFGAAGVSYFDLTPAFESEFKKGVRLHFPHDRHWTAKGHALAAQEIETFLTDRFGSK